MAVVVYSSKTKYSIAEGEYATVSEGHLFIYDGLETGQRGIMAVFAPGLWERFVRDGSVVRSSSSFSGTPVALTGDPASA